jgi:hypothetical protein
MASGVSCRGRCGIDRRQKVAADDADPERAGLIAVDELLDVLADAEQEDPLRRDQPDAAAEDRRLHEQVAQREQHADHRYVEDQHPAARVDCRDLGEEAQCQQAYEC